MADTRRQPDPHPSLTPGQIPPVVTVSARCRGCGARLDLTPDSFGLPSIDAMNQAAGHQFCQRCIVDPDDDKRP